MPFGPASLLGVERFSQESEAPLELIPGDDDAKKEQIIRAVYKQVLGNAYVMESERQLVAESQFKLGEISVRELVRRIAKSELYRDRLHRLFVRKPNGASAHHSLRSTYIL